MLAAEMCRLEEQFGYLDFCLDADGFNISESELLDFFQQLKKKSSSRHHWCLNILGNKISKSLIAQYKKLGFLGLHLHFSEEIPLDLLQAILSCNFHLTISLSFEKPDAAIWRALLVKKTGVEEVRFTDISAKFSEAAIFFEELINQVPMPLAQLLDLLKWQPVELFSVWKKWQEVRYPDRPVQAAFVFNTFKDFIDEVALVNDPQDAVFPKIKKKPLIFLGPSLSKEQASQILDAEYRPPIRRGDLPKALAEGYRVIGIVDGVFHHAFSVSLQEIREAIERGVKLYGSSSMGALRAADAYSLGMVGIGKIYSWYRSGKIDSDEEVALLFDETTGAQLTEPLVHLRAHLEKFMHQGYIDESMFQNIFKIGMQIPYYQRTRLMLLKQIESLLPSELFVKMQKEFSEEKTDLKGEDAIALLRQIQKENNRSSSA